MPRCARSLQHADYCHVINRGSTRARLFHNARDYEAFVALLAEAVERFDVPLISYCVMPNHWHLVAGTLTTAELSRSMQWLTGTHAARWSRAHARPGPGPVYQGRFKSIPVEGGVSLGRVCRYVERNALEAKLARRAEQWIWCSASQRLRAEQRPRLLALPFLATADWAASLNLGARDPEVAEAIRQSRPFGDREWASARLKLMGLSPSGTRGRPKVKLALSPFT
jgi:putative transposase